MVPALAEEMCFSRFWWCWQPKAFDMYVLSIVVVAA